MAEAAPPAPVAAPPPAAPLAPKLNPEQAAYQRAMDALEAIPAPAAKPEVVPPVVPPAAPPKPEETPRSREFARRAEQERAFRQREAQAKRLEGQLQERQAQLEQMQRELQAQAQETKSRQDVYRKDPIALMRDHGWDYETATRYVLEGKLPPDELVTREVSTLRAEMAALRTEQQEAQEAQQRAAEESAQQAQEAERIAAQQARTEAVAQVQGEIAAFVAANKERFELSEAFGKDAAGLIYRTIQSAYQKGEELTYEQGAQKVEEYLAAEVDNKVLKTKRYSQRDVNQLSDEALMKLAEAKGFRLVQAGRPPPPRGVAGAPPNPTPTSKKGMTAKERMDEAVRMMEEGEKARG